MADITVSELTSATAVTSGVSNGTGVYDKLMNTANLYLQDQYARGMLKGTDYANVLLGSIQSAMQLSMQYVLQEKLTEVQIESGLKDIELKQKQIESIDIENQIKDGQYQDGLLTSAKQRLAIDNEIDTRTRQVVVAEEQSTKDLSVKDVQIAQTNKQIEAIDIENTIKGLQSSKDLEVKTKQIEATTAEIVLKASQNLEVVDATKRANEDLNDKLATSDKQRAAIDSEIDARTRQIAVTEAQSVQDLLNKQKQVEAIDVENVIKDGQYQDSLLTAIKQRELLSSQKVTEDTNASVLGQKIVGRKQIIPETGE